jgi:(1->4)-alpha-D-glucan 1-alpha-D-glucosylmutase
MSERERNPAVPVSTYRLQITADWTLSDAAELVPYLTGLGVDWVYLSPILAAEAGSGHGYDVVDHGEVDPDRGGDTGLRLIAEAAHGAGHGVLVDVVPNHVGVATPEASVWWWDVLTHGRKSAYAGYFDIEWAVAGDKVRLPILGDGDDELDALRLQDGALWYYDHRLPIAPGTGDGTPREVLARQHYDLMNYRRADTELNYRRFFVVNDLAAIRVELPDVFAASHAEIGRWIDRGWVDGLRIDHPDGLAHPGRYLDDLAELTGGRYVLVEKILEGDETLPASWACAGTTGYDALAVIDRLFVDPTGEPALDVLDTQLRSGLAVDWPAMTRATKRAVADGLLRSEVLRLARLVPDVEGADDGIAELLSSLGVYRTYLPLGADHLTQAVARATTARPELADTLAELDRRLRDVGTEFSTRFQQTSGMVMAKGVEDCAFYRWSRLTSLTEVGGEPADFALSPSAVHDLHARRLVQFPATMTTLSTHDTKRAEDVRARISVISELPQDWAAAVRRWNRLAPLGDGALANLMWQAVVGAWPIERDRLHAFAEKAAREAGGSTAWIDPDSAFEERLHALVDAVYDDADLHTDLAGFADRLTGPGWSNSLSAKLVQLLAPGVPDVYQGSELWDLSLVDPDNRRPVDYRTRLDLLARLDEGWRPPVDPTGAVKLLVTSRALRLRRDRPGLFDGYAAVAADGATADHVFAFDRGGALAVVTRLPVGLVAAGGWRDTVLHLPPGDWRDWLTDRPAGSGHVAVADLLEVYPVAMLVREP